MSTELLLAFEQLARERGIAPEILFEAVEAAMIAAYKRNFGTAEKSQSGRSDYCHGDPRFEGCLLRQAHYQTEGRKPV